MTEQPDQLPQWRQAFKLLFDPSPAHVALLDFHGIILETNHAWNRFANENQVPPDYQFHGRNYLDAVQTSKAPDWRSAQQAYIGLQQVLKAQRPKFTMVYPCAIQHKTHWFRMWVESQMPHMPTVVVAHYLYRVTHLGQSLTAEDFEAPEFHSAHLDAG